MNMKYLLPLLLVGLVACSGEEAAAPATTEAAPAEAAPATTEAAPVVDESAPAAVASEDGTGIAECDDFLNAYQACVAEKVPAESRAVLEDGMKQWRKSWKDMAANEATRTVLPEVCTRARESAQAAISAYGCTF